MDYIFLIPSVVWINIFKYLNAKDLLHCASACSYWKTLAAHSGFWRRHCYNLLETFDWLDQHLIQRLITHRFIRQNEAFPSDTIDTSDQHRHLCNYLDSIKTHYCRESGLAECQLDCKFTLENYETDTVLICGPGLDTSHLKLYFANKLGKGSIEHLFTDDYRLLHPVLNVDSKLTGRTYLMNIMNTLSNLFVQLQIFYGSFEEISKINRLDGSHLIQWHNEEYRLVPQLKQLIDRTRLIIYCLDVQTDLACSNRSNQIAVELEILMTSLSASHCLFIVGHLDRSVVDLKPIHLFHKLGLKCDQLASHLIVACFQSGDCSQLDFDYLLRIATLLRRGQHESNMLAKFDLNF